MFATFNLQPGTSQSIPDHPEENICRCKSGGCYGGNAISLRPRCGQGDCSTHTSNCPSSDDEEENPSIGG